METLLATAGAGSGLQALIPPGMRAVTLEVNEFSSVGGMLEPGCRVDLISTMNDPKTREAMSRTILQNVKITAIGRNLTPPHPVEGQPTPPPSNNVTLLVTLKQAQALELACLSGRPWMVLRNYADHREEAVDSTPLSVVRNDATSSDASAPVPAQPTVALAPAPVPAPTTAPVAQANNFFKPVEETEIPAPPPTIRRTVTFIRNGVESQTTFVIPNPEAQNNNTAGTRDLDGPATGR
jgi:pilus assembly protein CpaB